VRFLLVLLLAGCYAHADIRPDQIPKLSDARTELGDPVDVPSYNAFTGTVGMTSVTPFSRSRVELLAPDGSTVVVKGDADLDLWTRDGRHFFFPHPIDASLDHGVLTIHGALGTVQVAVADVSRARVRSLSFARSIGAAVGGSLAFTALMFAPILL
jgi:hypothetical protein